MHDLPTQRTLSTSRCPSWCTVDHHQPGDDGTFHLVTATVTDTDVYRRTFRVDLQRCTEPDEPVGTDIAVHIDGPALTWDAPMGLEAAELLGKLLVHLVATSRATSDLQVCQRCGHPFHPDSSPNPFLCWQCDLEESEALAGVLAMAGGAR